MASSWGTNIKISLFGESHGSAIGAVVDGLPPGLTIDMPILQQFMKRRAPGRAKYATPRKEADSIKILSGVYHGKTTGTPLCGVIENTNIRSQDYENMPPRPSHADYTGFVRYLGANDPRGGGHFSGRLTAPLCFVGGIAKQILESYGVFVGAQIAEIAGIADEILPQDTAAVERLRRLAQKDFPVLSDKKGIEMQATIERARLAEDSVGGIVAGYAFGLPPGIGSPMFDGLENKISSLVFSIPAVRGIEFGTGFSASKMLGSNHNDPYHWEDGVVKTDTNHHGGILGGISSGMPITLSVAFKPTPSISQKQQSIDLKTGKKIPLVIHGRHDPCIVPRAVPVVEAAIATALLDALLEGGNPIAARTISNRD